MPRCFASAQACQTAGRLTQIVLVTDSRRLEARQHNPGMPMSAAQSTAAAMAFSAVLRRSLPGSAVMPCFRTASTTYSVKTGCRIAPPLLSIAAVCPATTAENLPPQNPNRAGSHRSPLPSAPCSMTEIAAGGAPNYRHQTIRPYRFLSKALGRKEVEAGESLFFKRPSPPRR